VFFYDSLSMRLGPESSELVTAVIGHHRGRARRPAGGANLTVLISVLEGLDHAKNLVDVATNRQIVHAHLAKDAFTVDDVSGTKCDALVIRVIQKAAIVAGNRLSKVGDHRDVHGAEATLLTRLHRIFSVGELRVDGATDKLAADGLKLSGLVTELANFSRAHEREVKRPEEQHNVFACMQ